MFVGRASPGIFPGISACSQSMPRPISCDQWPLFSLPLQQLQPICFLDIGISKTVWSGIKMSENSHAKRSIQFLTGEIAYCLVLINLRAASDHGMCHGYSMEVYYFPSLSCRVWCKEWLVWRKHMLYLSSEYSGRYSIAVFFSQSARLKFIF
jgi:hypothetical protein